MKYLFSLFLFTQSLLVVGQDSVQAFLPDLFANYPNVRDLSISPQSDEAYFTAQSPLGEISVIMKMDKIRVWTQPVVASFSGKYKDLEPALSPDGLKLFFVSDRPVHPDSTGRKDFDIWYVIRRSKGDKWSEPIHLESVNTEHGEYYPSIAQNGNLYFTSDRPGSVGKDDIYYSEWKFNTHSKPVRLSDSINTAGYEYNSFIAPDETYLIFGAYNRKDGFGSGDLYISYRKDGKWTRAKNMGSKINSAQMDYCPFVNGSGLLYFTSKRSRLANYDIAFNSTSELLKIINGTQNGLSKLYYCSFPKQN